MAGRFSDMEALSRCDYCRTSPGGMVPSDVRRGFPDRNHFASLQDGYFALYLDATNSAAPSLVPGSKVSELVGIGLLEGWAAQMRSRRHSERLREQFVQTCVALRLRQSGEAGR